MIKAERERKKRRGRLSYAAAMDEFNRSHREENKPIRIQRLLLFVTNFCHLNCPGRVGEREGEKERADKQAIT